ncbi:MAG TPA: PQQ-dependent sugar dehydrogenase [Nitrososphaeraceae archaeon]|nr:PQQ-dependent sugar dehydrogenase [Nitrososphaeraceae archaeon]
MNSSSLSSVFLYSSIIVTSIIFVMVGAYTISSILSDETTNLFQHDQQHDNVQYSYAAYTKAKPASGGPTLEDPNLQVERIFQGELGITTGMEFIGPNDILLLEKNEGKVHRIKDGVLLPEAVLTVSDVGKEIEWGMLGIAVDKVNSDSVTDPNNPITYVFLYFTEPASSSIVSNNFPTVSNMGKDDDNGDEDISDDGDADSNSDSESEGMQQGMANRLYRFELLDDKLVNPKLLLSLPANSPDQGAENNHDGGKVVVGPDHNVYVAIGDVGGHHGQAQNVQDGEPLDGTSGILRVTENGDPVNSFPHLTAFPRGDSSSSAIASYYYAYGIRNSFGMDFDPVTGNLWESENGADDNDEINLVLPGFNSGWSEVTGIASSSASSSSSSPESNLDEMLVTFNGEGKYRDPEFVSKQTIGPTALQFLSSDKLGTQYLNTMFMGDVNTGNLYNFRLNQDRTGLSLSGPLADKIADNYEELEPVIFGRGFGVITDMKDNPYDGYLYVLGYDGSIYKISP